MTEGQWLFAGPSNAMLEGAVFAAHFLQQYFLHKALLGGNKSFDL